MFFRIESRRPFAQRSGALLFWFALILIAPGGLLARGLLAQTDQPVDADWVLVGGTLYVGNGKPGKVGDVAIRGDRIVAVGSFPHGKIKSRLECKGLIISPGFIDLHNHSDTPATRKKTRALTNYLTQGCTTIVTGNCGSGPVDVGTYLNELDDAGIGANIAHLLPQGALRRTVMGTERRKATAAEMNEMKQLVAKAMQDGAWGMSTGLIYVPSSYADTKELIELAKVVSANQGIYVSHMRNEGTGLIDALNEALQIGDEASIPVHVSHFKSSGKDSWGLVRVAVDIIQKARAKGRPITADQYPYIASSTSLSATFFPVWARSGGRSRMLQRLEDTDDGPKIHAAIRKKLELTDQGQRVQIAYHQSQPAWAGKRLKEIADELKITPFDLILRIEKNGGASIVNYGINEADVRYVMTQPWVATASDGSSRIPSDEMPHPRSYGTFPRKIGYYSVQENVVPLEQAIRSSTGLPADILGIKDRGYLRSGAFADIAVWKKGELIDRATFKSPHRYSDGIRYLFVNGTPSIWEGDLTGALAGRALRHDKGAAREIEHQKVDEIVRRYFSEGSNGGVAVLVNRKGTTIHRKGYGSFGGRFVTPDTKLTLASVTKQFAALCAAMLIEEEKLQLDEKVSHYLPDVKLPVKGRELLVRDLLWHISGLPNFVDKKEQASIAAFKKQRGLKNLNNRTHAEWLTTIASRRPPGKQYQYTNSGYVLLTRIIEVVTGEPFHRYQQRRIFDPLQMNRTEDSTRFNGSGNMRTTLIDYAKWDVALWNRDPRLLSPQGFKMIFQPGKLDDGSRVDYGFGWMLTFQDGKLDSVRHGGWSNGFSKARNMVKRDIGNQLTVAVFAQHHPEFGNRAKNDTRTVRDVVCDEILNALREKDSQSNQQ